MENWEERLAVFWSTANDEDPETTLRDIGMLVAQLPDNDPVASFEMASAHDFLGEEAQAIPLYREALAAGLQQPRHSYAVVQLASSLRNVGEPDEAIELLETVVGDESNASAHAAFLALALFDAGRPEAALKTALLALVPSMTDYARAITHYAQELGQTKG